MERKEKNESKEHAATDQKIVDVPQTQFLDRVDDVPVVMQRPALVIQEVFDVLVNRPPQVPAVQVVPRTVELPQTLLIDSVEDIPVWQQRQVSQWTQFIDGVVDFPVLRQRLLTTGQTVQKIVEVPPVHYVDRIVGVPFVWQRQVPTVQTSQTVVERRRRHR